MLALKMARERVAEVESASRRLAKANLEENWAGRARYVRELREWGSMRLLSTTKAVASYRRSQRQPMEADQKVREQVRG